MATFTPIRIAIVGAGVGGLVLAIALRDEPHVQISIYEAQDKIEETGAGIACFGKSVQVITALGLVDKLAAIATCHPRNFNRLTFRTRKSDQEPGYTFATRRMGKGQTVHRRPFLNIFRQSLPASIRVHYGKRLVSYTQENPRSEVALTFADGTTATCDLLVGCDGIRSAVRRCMFPDAADAVWSGLLVYRALLPTSLIPGGATHPAVACPTSYCGQDKRIAAYPVAQGTMLNIVLHVTPDASQRGTAYTGGPWVAEATASEIREQYAGWEEEVQVLLSCFDKPEADLRLSRWAIHEVKPLETFVHGRVALLGDAAHAMQPHSGAGANQAIKDAYMLARLLRHSHDIDGTLRVYDAVQRPYAQAVAEASAIAGQLQQSLGTCDPVVVGQIGRRLETFDEWLKDGDVEADVQKALALLRTSSGSV